MKAILTHYVGPTERRGARIIASDSDGNRAIAFYNHSVRDPHLEAAVALVRKMGWAPVVLAQGGTRTGEAFVMLGATNALTAEAKADGRNLHFIP